MKAYIKFKIQDRSVEIKSDGILKKTFLSFIVYILRKILPEANPTFEKFIENVETWFLECDVESGMPTREIGIDKQGKAILKMPFKNNYGYWIDNNFLLDDFYKNFHAIEIEKKIFETNWKKIN